MLPWLQEPVVPLTGSRGHAGRSQRSFQNKSPQVFLRSEADWKQRGGEKAEVSLCIDVRTGLCWSLSLYTSGRTHTTHPLTLISRSLYLQGAGPENQGRVLTTELACGLTLWMTGRCASRGTQCEGRWFHSQLGPCGICMFSLCLQGFLQVLQS